MTGTQVHPLPPDMEREGMISAKYDAGEPPSAPLQPQPRNPDNGCCFQFCGRAPGPVDVRKILDAGGRWVQLTDGRIVEYYVYGSQSADAKILVQCSGSFMSGWVNANMPLVDAKLKELNIKGISISYPGFGYTTMIGSGYQIGQWPELDVEAVFAKEGLSGSFMVEGTSYGSAFAMAMATYFGERVSTLHLHVPYIPMGELCTANCLMAKVMLLLVLTACTIVTVG